MPTKKSKFISLVLITATLAACSKKEDEDWSGNKKVYIRSDSTASYTHHSSGAWLWFYAFRPYGMFSNGGFFRSGYYSNGISHLSNIGSNSFKSKTARGGFGRTGRSSSARS